MTGFYMMGTLVEKELKMPVQFRFEAPKEKQASRKLDSDDQMCIQNRVKHLKMELLAKIVNDIQLLTFFIKTHHLRRLTGF